MEQIQGRVMTRTMADTGDAVLDTVVREGFIKSGSKSRESLWEERQQEVQRLACRNVLGEDDLGYVKAVVRGQFQVGFLGPKADHFPAPSSLPEHCLLTSSLTRWTLVLET